MSNNNNQNQFAAIEVISANNQYIRNNYHNEAEAIRRSLPVMEPLPEISDAEKEQNLLASIRMSNEREMEQINQSMPLPDNINTNENANETSSPESNGSKRRKITQENRDVIKAIYAVNELTLEQKVANIQNQIDITRPYCMQLLNNLKKGISIDLSVVKKGRKKKYHSGIAKEIANALNEDNQMTDEQLAQHCTETFGFQCSRSSIQKIRNDKEIMNEAGLKPYTIKVCSRRGRDSNSLANKTLRKKVASDVFNSKERYKMVFIDETSWNIFSRHNYAKSPQGSKAIVHRTHMKCNMTAIMAMTRDGPLYTVVIRNKSVDTSTFKDYFLHVLKQLPPNQRFCFYLDNARIHNKQVLHDILKNTGHKIIFGAPYSPEMNPIELIFSIWKDIVEKKIGNDIPTVSGVVDIVENTWDKIEAQTYTNCVAHVYEQVYPKVMAMQDI